MKESIFLKLYQSEIGLKNREEVKERMDLFWGSVLEALENGERVVFKDWGVFYTKDVKSRKVVVPTIDEPFYSKPKKIIRFSCGKGLKGKVNKDD